MEENLRIRELCPVCHKGHLYPSGKVELEDGRTERHYKCDRCGNECKHIGREFKEVIDGKDSVERV